MALSKCLLRIAGVFGFIVSIFQAVISVVPTWSLYFGAPKELVSHSVLLLIAGLAAAVVFAIFALYALAGAGDIRPLPMLRMILCGIGAVYLVRGLLVIPQLLILKGVLRSSETIPSQMLLSSLFSLFIGVLYLIGTALGWRDLSVGTKR